MDGVPCQRLHTAHAFHSAMMTPALAPFAEAVGRVSLSAPAIPYVSNVTGTWITERDATDPAYWVRHLRETVRFSSGLRQLLEEPDRILLEVGPGHTLTSLARQHQATGRTIVSSMRHPNDPQPDADLVLRSGGYWVAGARWMTTLNAGAGRAGCRSRPTVRASTVLGDPKPNEGGPAIRRKATRKADLSTWFYAASWKRACPSRYARGSCHATQAPWLVFSDGGLGDRLAQTLVSRGLPSWTTRRSVRAARRASLPRPSGSRRSRRSRPLHKRGGPRAHRPLLEHAAAGTVAATDAVGRRSVHERAS
jgi:acyl transferase domain-containing protein